MSKLSRDVGSTSQILQVFIRDSSSTTGGGLTGLTNASAGLTAYYHRDTDLPATAISLVTMTIGTFTSSGFKEIDSTNMPGWYQFCPPNAALASGASSVVFHLKGATNMAPLPIEIDLRPVAYLSPGTGAGQITLTSGSVTAGTVSDKTGYSLASAQTFNVTGNITGSLSGSVGSVTTVSDKTGYSLSGTQTFNTTGNITGSVSGSVGSVTGSVGSVTGNVTVGTNNDKTGYSLAASQTFNTTGNITGSLSGSVGSVTSAVTLSPNLAVNITGNMVGNITGNLSGSVASVTGNVGGSVATLLGNVTLAATTHTGAIIPQVTTVVTTTNLTNLPAMPANWTTAAGIAADALNGKGDWNTVTPDNASIATILSTNNNQTTTLTWLQNYLGGDRLIDTAVTPWAEVVRIAGTATELTRKKLRDTAGSNITATTSVIASAKDS